MIVIVALHSMPKKIFNLFEDHGLTIKVHKGSHIFREGERAENIFFIQSRAIQINKETEQGKELTIRISRANGIIGESAMFCFAKSIITRQAQRHLRRPIYSHSIQIHLRYYCPKIHRY